MSIGTNIRDARKAAGLTQVELAKKTSLSRSYIGDIEKDRYNPSLSTLQAIAKATEVPTGLLLGSPPPVYSNHAPIRKGASAPHEDVIPTLDARDAHDIQKKLQSLLDDLDPDAGPAYYNGEKPMDDETRDLIRASLENSLRIAKQMAKTRYTPEKYQQTDDTAERIGKKILDASPSAQRAISQIIDEDKNTNSKES